MYFAGSIQDYGSESRGRRSTAQVEIGYKKRKRKRQDWEGWMELEAKR
jgi:Pyruvate/2-oxoacid:ferredoxin oxidoreductase gamma subunit